MTQADFADLTRTLHQYGFDPYNSDSGDEWVLVAQNLGLPL